LCLLQKGNLEEDGRAPRLVSKSVLFQDDTTQSGTVDPYDVGKHFLRGTLIVLGEDWRRLKHTNRGSPTKIRQAHLSGSHLKYQCSSNVTF